MKITSTRGTATRQKILKAAVDLVNRHGFNGTSIDDILAASGTGKSQFYHHFESKSQLLRQLLDFHQKTMPLSSILSFSGFNEIADFEFALDQLVEAHLKGQFPYGCPVSNLATELVASQTDLLEIFQIFFQEIHTKFREIIKRWRYRGLIQQDINPEQVANFIVASIEGALLLAKITGSSDHLLHTANQLKFFIKSLGQKSAPKSQRRSAPKPVILTYCP